jgi:hypothetical protein
MPFQNKRSVFFKLSTAPAVSAQGQKAMSQKHHARLQTQTLKWGCLTIQKSLKRH